MRNGIIVIAALGALWGAAVAGEPEHDTHGRPPAEDARFEFLKGLAGTWIGTSDGSAEELFEFRVVAGGHAVEEREMVGTPMEMLTVYHMDGKDLVGTHYCAMGNQPHVVAARSVVDETLSFACAGKPGNTRSHDEEHVHGWSMQLREDGSLHYSAELAKQGGVSQAPSFVLTRKTETARR